MKIKCEKQEEQLDSKMVKDIKIGTVFSGTAGGCNSVYVKKHSNIIDLANMSHLPKDDPDGRGCCLGIERIYNYKELNAEVVVRGEK